MKKLVFIIFASALLVSGVIAQDKKEMKQVLANYVDSMATLSYGILDAGNDADKYMLNDRLIRVMKKALTLEGSFNYDYSKVEKISILKSPDKRFNIYTWVIPKTNGTYEYFGFIQHRKRKRGKFDLHQLTDQSDSIEDPVRQSLDNNSWYGALYYEIIPVKRGLRRYYTLIGWDGNDHLTNKKVIDIAYVTRKVNFGAPLFMDNGAIKKRVIFEYNEQAVMSVKYHKSDNMIIFDHLVPAGTDGKLNTALTGMYQFYGPDGSYDAYHYDKGKWRITEIVDARNPKSTEPKKKFNQPQDEGPQRLRR